MALAVDCLAQGGLVAFPTETVYGLGADATNAKAIARLYQAKGDNHQAADCYRKVIAFARNEPHFYDPHFIDHFHDLIDRLESQATAAD